MTEEAAPQKSSSHHYTKQTLAIGISTIIATLSNLIQDAVLRQIMVSLSAPLGYGLAFVIKVGFQEFQHRRVCNTIESWIADINRELQNQNLSVKRRAELEKELQAQKKLLQKHKLDNLKTKIE